MRPRNGLARWCSGIKAYIPGDKIEPEEIRHENLASQCLPAHYDPSGVPQLAGLNKSGQAIASAPVTCELCHVGLAGFDSLREHCAQKHCGLAEYRKRKVGSSPNTEHKRAALCRIQKLQERSFAEYKKRKDVSAPNTEHIRAVVRRMQKTQVQFCAEYRKRKGHFVPNTENVRGILPPIWKT